MTTLLRMQNVSVRRADRAILDDINLHLDAGERVVIRGAIGSGKTTLLLAALGLLPHESGTIELLGSRCRSEKEFALRRAEIGLLFQDPDDQLLGPTVLEDIEFGPLNLGWTAQRAHHAADIALAKVGLAHLAERPVHEISGGEKRLVALAGLLAMAPKVLLLDEPTVSLDEPSAQQILDILIDSGLSMLIATHDPFCIDSLATRCVVLQNGRIQSI
jgi:cobalt/nickel transport system ATP-binding protein